MSELIIIEEGDEVVSDTLNFNFKCLDEKAISTNQRIETVSASIKSVQSTLNSQLSSSILSNLEAVYPVGSLYIGATGTCPIANLFGTWEKVAGSLVVDIDSNVPVKGNGMAIGLTNGTTNYGARAYTALSGAAPAIGGNTAVYGATLPNNSKSGSYLANVAYGITTDASKSGIVGTANTTKLEVNIWKRTA